MYLDHISIIISQIEHLKFYEALDFGVISRTSRSQCHDEIVIMQGNGVTLGIYVDATHPQRVNNPEANGLRHFALRTDDLDAVIAKLQEAGYVPEPIRTMATGQRYTFVKDSDGLPVELREG